MQPNQHSVSHKRQSRLDRPYLAPLQGTLHGGHDFFVAGPRSPQELGKQSSLTGNDRSAVHDDFKLPESPLFQFYGSRHGVTDEGSETRRLCCARSSRVAVDDLNGHGFTPSWSGALIENGRVFD